MKSYPITEEQTDAFLEANRDKVEKPSTNDAVKAAQETKGLWKRYTSSTFGKIVAYLIVLPLIIITVIMIFLGLMQMSIFERAKFLILAVLFIVAMLLLRII
jgi:ABC-type multidrug transport system permease subunit